MEKWNFIPAGGTLPLQMLQFRAVVILGNSTHTQGEVSADTELDQSGFCQGSRGHFRDSMVFVFLFFSFFKPLLIEVKLTYSKLLIFDMYNLIKFELCIQKIIRSSPSPRSLLLPICYPSCPPFPASPQTPGNHWSFFFCFCGIICIFKNFYTNRVIQYVLWSDFCLQF